ncbi:S-layer homology domain-containing protein [Paenibacillus taihuensis]|uniref:S-layer homology domain-containing protein n=1 Tax=Paenibacillus taihuensis TaxID=1156355 RepID=UPI000E2633B3
MPALLFACGRMSNEKRIAGNEALAAYQLFVKYADGNASLRSGFRCFRRIRSCIVTVHSECCSRLRLWRALGGQCVEQMVQGRVFQHFVEPGNGPEQADHKGRVGCAPRELFGYQDSGAANYKDVAEDAWYNGFVKLVSSANILTGYDGYFRPQRSGKPGRSGRIPS